MSWQESLLAPARRSGEAYHTYTCEGSEIKWLRSETFLFWRAAGEIFFALEPPNKPFPLIFKWDKAL